MVSAAAEPRWLNADEARAWRAYVIGIALLQSRLHRELQEEHDISLTDYEMLVRLSEQPCRRMRMASLAADMAASKSRVSHQVARLEKAGLVRRTMCPSDGRGIFAEMTESGWDALRIAAPTHVRGVREHLIDLLDENELAVMARIFDRMQTHLRATDDA